MTGLRRDLRVCLSHKFPSVVRQQEWQVCDCCLYQRPWPVVLLNKTDVFSPFCNPDLEVVRSSSFCLIVGPDLFPDLHDLYQIYFYLYHLIRTQGDRKHMLFIWDIAHPTSTLSSRILSPDHIYPPKKARRYFLFYIHIVFPGTEIFMTEEGEKAYKWKVESLSAGDKNNCEYLPSTIP